MGSTELAFASIRDLARLIRCGETTPTALAEYFLDRLETVGRRLNAVVTITRERALREARLAEEELAAGYDRGLLHGIPYGAKDLLATAGIPTTWGAAPLRDQVFPEDATAIVRLRDAGAVLVGKLAMVEIAGGMGYTQPNASLTGPGINPWNEDAWSGGSSSGSGSAVGAGAVPFALGSETWGSILVPASYCGVAGLRPTYGRVSRRGAMALCWTLDKIGPLCRTADDCGLVLAAIAGPDPGDPTTLPSVFQYAPASTRSAGFRLGVLREGLDAMQPEVRDSFLASLDVLAECATLEDVALPDFPYGEAATIIVGAEGAAAHEELIEGGRIAGLTAPECRLGGYAGTLIPAVDYLRALRIRRHVAVALDQLFARHDAIVCPATGVVASPLSLNFDEYAGTVRRLTIGSAGNLAGLPAISVHNGFGERGLPTGLQIVGRTGAESTILAVARAYEARTPWHAKHPTW
ncbi:MAG: amidase [Chloroflexi bacterium]|nr:amidase [Chloroflexota bacterium]